MYRCRYCEQLAESGHDCRESLIEGLRERVFELEEASTWPHPLEGSARSRILLRLGVTTIDAALERVDYLETLLSDLARNPPEDGPCALCGTGTTCYAGNSGMWPIELEYAGGNGDRRIYHRRCVVLAIEQEQLRLDQQKGGASERDDAEGPT